MDADADGRFTAFAVSRGTALLRLAFVLTGDSQTAEDIVQSALAKSYASWPRVERAGNPEAYVRRILVNTTVDAHRLRRRQPALTDVEPPENPAAIDVSAEVVSMEQARALLASLPPRQRAVVALRYLEDLTEAATAAELGISVGAVKSHTSRALAKLREASREHA